MSISVASQMKVTPRDECITGNLGMNSLLVKYDLDLLSSYLEQK